MYPKGYQKVPMMVARTGSRWEIALSGSSTGNQTVRRLGLQSVSWLAQLWLPVLALHSNAPTVLAMEVH